jgi:hypothetical protein
VLLRPFEEVEYGLGRFPLLGIRSLCGFEEMQDVLVVG